MTVLFDADIRGVGALLPDRIINANSKPTTTQVTGFLELTSGWVAGRLGLTTFDQLPVTGGDAAAVRDALTGLAQHLVEVGAAALAEVAAARSLQTTTTSPYGEWLWERFTTGIDEILEALGRATTATAGGGAVGLDSDAAHGFPDSIFTAQTRF